MRDIFFYNTEGIKKIVGFTEPSTHFSSFICIITALREQSIHVDVLIDERNG